MYTHRCGKRSAEPYPYLSLFFLLIKKKVVARCLLQRLNHGRRSLSLSLSLSFTAADSRWEKSMGEWREFYERKVRSEGRVRKGCGAEAIEPGERRIITRYSGQCFVCEGRYHPGDWVWWNQDKKRSRHAPSGWKDGDAGAT